MDHSPYVLELTRNLLEFQKAGYLCDTVIIVDDGQLKAHRAVLAAASPLFSRALALNNHTVIMPGIQLSVAEIILKYMYTGNIEVQGKCVDQVNRLKQAVQAFGINLQLVVKYDSSVTDKPKTSEADHREIESVTDDTVISCNQSSPNTDPSLDGAAERGSLDEHTIAHRPDSEKEAAMMMAAVTAKQDIFPCKKCGETYPNKSRLRRHISEKHKRVRSTEKTKRRCTCPICGKTLKYCLSVHMRSHTGERPYKCATCGKAYYQHKALRDHLMVHTGAKPYTCTECGESFRLSSTLRYHMQKHAGTLLRHACTLCDKKLISAAQLRQHLMLHTGERPFQCAICGRRFRLKNGLVKCERRHLGETAPRCGVCGIESRHLKQHMLIHTGSKPHCCDHCGKAFRRKEHLRAHCLRLHNVELPKREKVQVISPDSCLLKMQTEDTAITNADDCGVTLEIGDTVEL